MAWYAIRTVYHFGMKDDGKNVFEERVVCFQAESWKEAHDRAREESHVYAEANDFTPHPEQVGYEQDNEALIDGYELWSELYEDNASLEEFYAKRYTQFEHHPELPNA